MLQTRNGKRTAVAALKIACDLVDEGMISEKEAVLMIDPKQLDALLTRSLTLPLSRPLSLLRLLLLHHRSCLRVRLYSTAEDAVEQGKTAKRLSL